MDFLAISLIPLFFIGMPLLFIVGGVLVFISGFNDFRARRDVDDTPTSNIQTGAVGTNVEIRGRVLLPEDKPLTAPLSGTPCSFFGIEINRIDTEDDFHLTSLYNTPAIFLQDSSGGVAMVCMNNMTDVRCAGKPHTRNFKADQFDQMPDAFKQFLKEKEEEDALGWFSLKRTEGEYRFIEKVFGPEDSIYVHGYARSAMTVQGAREAAALIALVLFDQKIVFRKKKWGPLPFKIFGYKGAAKDDARQMERVYGKAWLEKVASRTRMVFGFKKGSGMVLRLNPVVSNMSDIQVKKSIRNSGIAAMVFGPLMVLSTIIWVLAFSGAIK